VVTTGVDPARHPAGYPAEAVRAYLEELGLPKHDVHLDLARIRSLSVDVLAGLDDADLAQRAGVPVEAAPLLRVGDLVLDPAAREVHRAGKGIRLTSKEFALLEVLARHPGQVFPQDRLIDAVWDADFTAESNVVEVYIRSLRRKIDGGRRDGLIETVRGAGYRLRPHASRRA